MANITPQQQQVIDSLAGQLGPETPGDAGIVAAWKKTLAGLFDAVSGTYYFVKTQRLIDQLRADPTLDQVQVEKLAKFLGV